MMTNYIQAIKTQEPLDKTQIWEQCKRDFKVSDAQVSGKEDDMRRLCEELMVNRISDAPIGRRFITEYNLRNKIHILLTTPYFEEYVDGLKIQDAASS